MPKVFISHSWVDNDISKKIAEYLRRDGVEIWIDYLKITGGESLPKRISEALEWCDTLVLLWSNSAASSYYVELEWQCTLDLQKKIIPCLLDDTKRPAILRGFLFIDFKDFDKGYNELCRAFKLESTEEKFIKLQAEQERQKNEQERLQVLEAEKKEEEKQLKLQAEQEKQKKEQERLQLQEAERKEKEKQRKIQAEQEKERQQKLQAEQERQKREQERLRLEEAEREEKEKQRRWQAEQERRKKEQERLQKLQKDKHRKERIDKLKRSLITKKTGYTILSLMTIFLGIYIITTILSSNRFNNQNGENVSGTALTGTVSNFIEKDLVPKTRENAADTVLVRKSEPYLTNFRREPASLSNEQVKAMLTKNGFFDSYKNTTAKGFNNQFETKIINGKSVVIDHASGLMWQQGGSAKYLTYDKAKEYIQEINRTKFAGFMDWRLPTLEEAMSLMEPKKLNGDLYIGPKFNAKQRWIWTADQISGESRAWVVDFSTGRCGWNSLLIDAYVRTVRFVQSSTE